MAIDANGLAKACGAKKGELDIANHLCRTQIEEFQRRAKGADTLLVACTQEAPLFLETLDETGQEAGSGVTDQLGADQKTATGTQQITPDIRFTNIREKAGWSKDEVDLWEINEAFAVVTMAAMKEHALSPDIVNIHGGACAMGHPIGSSGSRIIATLIGAMQKHNLKKGVATLCIGGGEATAMAIERAA